MAIGSVWLVIVSSISLRYFRHFRRGRLSSFRIACSEIDDKSISRQALRNGLADTLVCSCYKRNFLIYSGYHVNQGHPV
jgi:hypothetical protein